MRKLMLAVVLLTSAFLACRTTENGSTGPVPGNSWCEVYARAFAFNVSRERGSSYNINAHWQRLDRFGIKEPPEALFQDVRAREGSLIRFQCIFAPWGNYSYELSPQATELLDIVTITPEAIVFIPVPRIAIKTEEEAEYAVFKKILEETTEQPKYSRELRDYLSAPLPSGLQFLSLREYQRYAVLSIPSAGNTLSDENLLSLVPGKIVVLQIVPETGPIRVRILSPRNRNAGYSEKDAAIRLVFAEAIGEAAAIGTDEHALRLLYLKELDKFHKLWSGPGEDDKALFEQARDTLVAFLGLPGWIIGEEETLKIFPDYTPKRSADTLLDYRGSLSPIVLSLPEAKLPNLVALLDLFADYKQKANEHPGEERQGRIYLGEDERQYSPSDEELIAGELGERIELIVNNTPRAELNAFLKEKAITLRGIEFGKITFRHSDVMGSGRFFYASRPEKTAIILQSN